MKALLFESGGAFPPSLGALELEEAKAYGPWTFPWSPDELLECAARSLRVKRCSGGRRGGIHLRARACAPVSVVSRALRME